MTTEYTLLSLKSSNKSTKNKATYLTLHVYYSLDSLYIFKGPLCRAHQLGNETDLSALLAIKSQLLDHSVAGVLDSWNNSVNHCSWDGVVCGPKHNRVTVLDLSSRGLGGTISPFIGNLSFVKDIELYGNNLVGHIPPELGRLFRLQSLYVFSNEFSGKIPSNLSACLNLEKLCIGYNKLQGKLPPELRTLSKLTFLWIQNNNLSGSLFEIIINMTALQVISAAYNSFTGHISTNIGKFQNLNKLEIGFNEISSTFPNSLLNLTSIETLDFSQNHLRGEIPPDIGLRLPHLVKLHLEYNQFSGTFPNSLLNLTNIQILSLAENNFVGRIPDNLGRLHNLTVLGLDSNHFEGDINFISSLVNCTNLQAVEVGDNKFTGIIPESVSNLSRSFEFLSLQNCGLSGNIPKHISNLINLVALILSQNYLVGSIPHTLGILQNLEFIDLSQNLLNGTLQIFKGSHNFVYLNLSYNHLEGSILQDISSQMKLVTLDLSQNKLSGILPDGLGQCVSLEQFVAHGNFFHGVIPISFGALGSLQLLDLSRNNLSGEIPKYFSYFSQLVTLNLSYNNFEGEVPTTGVFLTMSEISLDGNVKLCGGIPKLHLPRCKITSELKKREKTHRALKLNVSLICALVGVLIVTALLYLTCHKNKRVPTSSGWTKDELMKVSYDMLLKATNGFSPENLIGVGTFGSVFKGTLDGENVAVKVLNLQTRGASKSFMAECKALRNVRHRNLVGIITACSSIDHHINDFKALLYEFMPNGSLDERLHGNRVENITLLQRVDIAIDVAHALSYLHHDCEVPIVHCDLKPTNVLLDEDMVARVGDFGLAKFLAHPQHPNQSSSIGVRGTVGYAAPEYGLGSEPCTDGDVYSYGILVLELMTGKKPTDSMFQEEYNLHTYTEAAFPDNVLEIVDQTLLEDNTEINDEDAYDIRATRANNQRRYECIVDVISVGIACSKHVPRDRMKIKEAISKLQAARSNLCNDRRNRNYVS